jgi:hypothetical protein
MKKTFLLSFIIVLIVSCKEKLPPSVSVYPYVVNADTTVYTILWVRGDGKNIIDSEYFTGNDFTNKTYGYIEWCYAKDTNQLKHLAYKYFNQ